MSNRRKPVQRLRGSAEHIPMPTRPGEGYAFVTAILDDRHDQAAVDGARRITHDRLIAAWGDKRRSGIFWLEQVGKSAIALYKQTSGNPQPEPLAMLERNPRAMVIVAGAIVEGPEPPNPGADGFVEVDR